MLVTDHDSDDGTSEILARHERELSFATWPESRRVECVLLGEDQLLWGLTLRVLDPLLPRLLAGEWAI